MYYEVLDEQGHKTGQLLDPQTIHAKQLWHEVVNVWIINNKNEVLLQLRGPGVELSPNVWDVAVGTHVRPAEDPLASALRCLQTELGITITPDQLKHLFNIQSANPMQEGKVHRVLGHVFLLKRDLDIADLTINTEKIAQLIWKPMVALMAEVGSEQAAGQYFVRAGTYYPQLFDAFQTYM